MENFYKRIMSSLGTELKINVHVEPIDGYHMEDYDFVCSFFVYEDRRVEVSKSSMKRVDSDNYMALLVSDDGRRIGRGRIQMEVTAYIPDGDFADGVRIEKAVTCTGVTIT